MTELVKKPVTLFSIALILVLVPLGLHFARTSVSASPPPAVTAPTAVSENVASTMIRARAQP